MNSEIFRKYDIRGIADRDLTDEAVKGLGYALGRICPGGTLAIGRDCRPSGERLSRCLAEGAAAAGCGITDLGVQTTPMTYFAAKTLEPDVTVMITGSHNPPDYNGFKVMKGLRTLWGDDIQALKNSIENSPPPPAAKPVIQRVSVREDYLRRLRSEFSPASSLRIAVDAGNGTGGDCAVEILTQMGHRVFPLYCTADGTFPNHHPDPTVISNLTDLMNTVRDNRCDLGIAFDGDADRLGIVDETGSVIFGDRILCVLAEQVLRENPGATVISEVKASSVFFSRIEQLGGRPLMMPTGHSIIKEAMHRENALLAGEMSGHIFFRDRYYGYDDALYAALRFIEAAERAPGPVSTLTRELPDLISTPEIREDCDDSVKFLIADRVRELLVGRGFRVTDIDGVRVDFPDGWGLLRGSNTQPVLVMRFEAGTRAALDEYEKTVRNVLEQAREELQCPENK